MCVTGWGLAVPAVRALTAVWSYDVRGAERKRVPVWRPAFQAGGDMKRIRVTPSAGLRPACRLKPAFQAVLLL